MSNWLKTLKPRFDHDAIRPFNMPSKRDSLLA